MVSARMVEILRSGEGEGEEGDVKTRMVLRYLEEDVEVSVFLTLCGLLSMEGAALPYRGGRGFFDGCIVFHIEQPSFRFEQAS